MAVIVLNDAIEKVLERHIGVVRTCIDTDARVEILASREDTSLERDAS